jgi:transglutaminase-like putative cysteine protease
MPYRTAESAFVRGAPLPAWAQACELPPVVEGPPAAPAVLTRIADTQLWAGELPSCLVHRAEQVNDAAALAQVGHVTIPFNPQYQRLLLHRLRVLRDGLATDHAATAPLQLLQREAGLEQGVMRGVVTATLLVPDLRVGDTLQLVYTIEGENPIFGERYAGWAGWDQNHAVALRRVSLTMPAHRRITWRWVGDRPGPRPTPIETLHDGLRRWQWEGRELAAVPFEPYLPRDAQPLRWLQFTEFASWREVAQWALQLFPLDAPLPAELDAQLHAWRALPSPERQVLHALQWVQQEIRYCSVSLGESSHRPQAPVEVVARRYGDCKDKSLLLVSLLRALGIEARPVLAAAQTRQGPLKLLPSPEAFDHVIVQVRLDGREHYLDATRLGQSGGLDHIGQGMEDAAVLVVAPDTDALSQVRSAHREQHFGNELHERYVLERFDDEARLDTEQHWHGLGAESLRAMLQRMDGAQLAQWALGRYERRHPGVRLDGAPRIEHDAQRNRLTVHARYRVPGAAQRHDGEWSLRFVAANLHGAFVLPESLARTMPLMVPSYPGRLHYSVEVLWPEATRHRPGHQPLEPQAQRLQTPHFELEVARSVIADGRGMRHTATLRATTGAVPPQELPRLADDLQRLDGLVHGRFVTCDRHASTPRDVAPNPLVPRLAQQLLRQIEASNHAIARGDLHGEDLAGIHLLRAHALAELGRSAEALADLQAAAALAPGSVTACAARGKVLWALGRFDEAEADFARAMQLASPALA